VFPEQYEEQLAAKINQVKDLFAAHKLPAEIEVHRSSTEHFRMRTEFRMWHEVGLSLICQQLQGTQLTAASTPAVAQGLTAAKPLHAYRERTFATLCLSSRTALKLTQLLPMAASFQTLQSQTPHQQQKQATQMQRQLLNQLTKQSKPAHPKQQQQKQ
jgi:tRNA (uracil-5-)-methyltransferase